MIDNMQNIMGISTIMEGGCLGKEVLCCLFFLQYVKRPQQTAGYSIVENHLLWSWIPYSPFTDVSRRRLYFSIFE